MASEETFYDFLIFKVYLNPDTQTEKITSTKMIFLQDSDSKRDKKKSVEFNI